MWRAGVSPAEAASRQLSTPGAPLREVANVKARQKKEKKEGIHFARAGMELIRCAFSAIFPLS
jgi:hypothetical protein